MLICPICDSTLTNRFCPVCRKFVKEPWVLDDHVYINRSHSLPDDFCEFHGNGRKVTYLNRTADKKSPLISGKVNAMPKPSSYPARPVTNSLSQKARVSGFSGGTDAFHAAYSKPGQGNIQRKK